MWVQKLGHHANFPENASDHTRDYSIGLMIMKIGQSICLNEI